MVAMVRSLTIGALSRRTGVSVKRLRFYSDEGLIPPSGRSRSGYRLYGEEHVRRIEVIRTLREAGMGLDEIERVLRHDVSLRDALELRLEAVEAHITGLQRVAIALRHALRSGATEEQLRRIAMVTKASNEDRRQVVAAFYDKVHAGLPVSETYKTDAIDAGAPAWSAAPTPVQIGAWVELESLMGDPTFVSCRRKVVSDMFGPEADRDAFFDLQYAVLLAVADARSRGVSPSATQGREIVDRFARDVAKSRGRAETAIREEMCVRYDPRGARYWELVSIMRGDPPPAVKYDDWRWLGEALIHHASKAA